MCLVFMGHVSNVYKSHNEYFQLIIYFSSIIHARPNDFCDVLRCWVSLTISLCFKF